MMRMSLERVLSLVSILLALSAVGMMILPGITAGIQVQASDSQADLALRNQGASLFRNLGCVSCHVHGGVTGETGTMGILGVPDLTHYRGDPEFLRLWLADPASQRPGTQMPDLRLSPEEIEALVAFLEAP